MIYFAFFMLALLLALSLYSLLKRLRRDYLLIFLKVVALVMIGLGALYLILTGKLIALLGVIPLMLPFVISLKKYFYKEGEGLRPSSNLTEEMAWQIFDLQPGASEGQIKHRYYELMQRVHPDQGGSHYLASQINQAHDILTGKAKRSSWRR